MNRYHCFWTNPFGMSRKSLETDDLAAVLALVKKDQAGEEDYSDVRGLVVVYGERLAFEPAVVVQTYRIAEPVKDLTPTPHRGTECPCHPA